MKPPRSGLALVALALVATHGRARAAEPIEIVRQGRAQVEILLASDAIPSEVTAARELADYLERITSASFVVRQEGPERSVGPAIHVGPTRAARALGLDPRDLPPEAWRVRTRDGELFLVGGRPRGTLYAVYRFLEDQLGVRWWTPWEESWPRRRRLSVGALDVAGRPAFGFRDVTTIDGPAIFAARSRLNGHTSRLPENLGGRETFGPPEHVHNFFDYVDPALHFSAHPEWFSEIDGQRVDDAQLCLTDPALLDFVTARMAESIEQGSARSLARGETPPRLFGFSANDRRGSCECRRCSDLAARGGSESAPLVAFVGELARRIGREHPDVLIDTLAYLDTLQAPVSMTLPDNVVVRISSLQLRDFAQPLSAPANERVRRSIDGWKPVLRRRWIWDYTVTFGRDGDLPLPNLAWIGEDLRRYEEHGVEGLFIQHEHQISADLRDLKLWVLTRLVEDPYRDVSGLVTEFTDGFYGPGGRWVRRYLTLLARVARERPGRVGYPSRADQYPWLDRGFLVEAHALFDRAESAAAGNLTFLRRLRHARLSLDRATLTRWRESGLSADPGGLELPRIANRYRRAWFEQIALRGPRTERTAEDAERHAAGLVRRALGVEE